MKATKELKELDFAIRTIYQSLNYEILSNTIVLVEESSIKDILFKSSIFDDALSFYCLSEDHALPQAINNPGLYVIDQSFNIRDYLSVTSTMDPYLNDYLRIISSKYFQKNSFY